NLSTPPMKTQRAAAAQTAHILTLSCKDRTGLVASVTGLLFECGGNILESQQFDDLKTGNFFMRIVFDLPESAAVETLRERFATIVTDPEATWNIRPAAHRKKVLLMVSKFDHCLGDLLYRLRIG